MVKKKKQRTQKQKIFGKAKSLIKRSRIEFVIGLGFLTALIILVAYSAFGKVQKNQTPQPLEKTEKTKTKPKQDNNSYVLKEGESLWDVADKEYGNPYLYPTLTILNNLTSPDMIEPGMKIKIR